MTRSGISLADANQMKLWELHAALGLHRMETVSDYTEREIIEKSEKYFEETREQRMEKLTGYVERRKAREKERRAEKRGKVT